MPWPEHWEGHWGREVGCAERARLDQRGVGDVVACAGWRGGRARAQRRAEKSLPGDIALNKAHVLSARAFAQAQAQGVGERVECGSAGADFDP